jgi:O-antigen/teichoic acid export membrane protein
MFPLAFYTVFTTALRGKQRMGSYAILNLALVVLQVAAVVWFGWIGGSLIALVSLLLLVQVVAAVLAAILCSLQFADIWLGWQLSLHKAWSLVKASAPIAMLGLLGILYLRLSLLILPLLAGAAVTGWFSAGARLIEAAKIGHVAVFTALYPLMAQVGTANKFNWSSTFRLTWLLLLGGAVLASSAICILAGPLVTLLYGPEYIPSISSVQILAWVLIPYTVNAFLSLAFLAREDEGAIAVALATGILALVILTIWWEPLIGLRGAAWAAVCAELVQSAILVARDFRTGRLLQSMLKPRHAF